MRTFILISKLCIDTHIEFYFNDAQCINGFNVIGPSYTNAYEFALKMANAKILLVDFLKLKDASYQISEKLEELTFEKFWLKYNDKIRSSKKRTLQCWNRMSKAEQLKAFNYIQTYVLNIPSGCEKKYAETYLNSELWNN